MSIRDWYEAGFIGNDIGKVTGTATGAFLPSVETSLVMFKADPSNNGRFLIGESSAHCFYPLVASEETDWIPIHNLNELYVKNASGSNNFLYYWAKK